MEEIILKRIILNRCKSEKELRDVENGYYAEYWGDNLVKEKYLDFIFVNIKIGDRTFKGEEFSNFEDINYYYYKEYNIYVTFEGVNEYFKDINESYVIDKDLFESIKNFPGFYDTLKNSQPCEKKSLLKSFKQFITKTIN